MKTVFLYIVSILLFVSCTEVKIQSSYAKAMELLESDEEEALRLFSLAIAEGDHTQESHYHAAMLCDKDKDKILLTVWHLREYLRISTKLNAEERQEAEKWLEKSERKLAISIARKLEESIMEESKLQVKLLEEHAIRQKQWIQELTIENQKLRLQLAEGK